ncbi:Holliday junction resolvase RuvX [Alphaproteobacteria bacterium]|nr:Holliday junction resolvase RuvX [Alphaproteobacteria bacterium]MDB9870981.1 Holliday junction resolvase RuvX [Alphaproteobacteria bacterium]
MPIFKPDEFLLNILPKKRILGIDPGTKTLGIAVSDSNLMVASPISTIKRKKIKSDIEELFNICEKYNISGIVMGWPLNMDGSIGPRCNSVRDFIKSLLNIKDLPILLQDERMSTMAIEKPMIIADLSRKKRSSRTDQLAACWILQSALDGLQKKM